MKNYQFVNVWRRRVTFDLFFFFVSKFFLVVTIVKWLLFSFKWRASTFFVVFLEQPTIIHSSISLLQLSQLPYSAPPIAFLPDWFQKHFSMYYLNIYDYFIILSRIMTWFSNEILFDTSSLLLKWLRAKKNGKCT